MGTLEKKLCTMESVGCGTRPTNTFVFIFLIWAACVARTSYVCPGVDVMIIIFCDICQLSAKKMAVFSKPDVMIKFFAKTSSRLSKKRQYFR
jgi:hypothetical protein